MKTKNIWLFSLLLPAVLSLRAETTLTGKVVSTDGTPLEGVILSVTGTQLSAKTGEDGTYSLTVPDASCTVGLACPDHYSRTVRMGLKDGGQTFVMVPLTEVDYSGQVALPQQTLLRDDAPATLESVYKKDFSASPSADLSWQDVSPALRVERKSGMPGEGAWFNIRGLHTLNAENTPLLVINGVPYLANTAVSDVINGYSRDALFGYNAADIRSITVLKGADAARYGALGSNGVILLETEQATSDNLDTRVSFSGNYGMSRVQRQLPSLGVQDYAAYLMEIGQTRYSSIAALETDYPFLSGNEDYYEHYLFDNQTDWTSQIYDNAFVTDNILRVEGGDEVAKYNISFGYTRESGTLTGTQTSRYHTALNTNIMVSSDFEIFTAVNLAYVNSSLNNTGMSEETNPILAAYHMMPNLSPYQKLSDGGIIYGRYLAYDGWNVNDYPSYAYDNVSNPLALVNTVEGKDKIYDANVQLGFNYRPSLHWDITGVINLYYDYTEESVFTPGVTDRAILPQLFGTGENYVSMGVIRQEAYYFNLQAGYHNLFAGKHAVDLTAGARLMTKKYEYDASSGYNTGNDYNRTLSKVTDEWSVFGNHDSWNWLGFYLTGDYTYNQLWRARASLSVDGTSASGSDAPRFGFFPSASLTYLAANHGNFSDNVDRFNITAEVSWTGNTRFSSDYGRNYYVSTNLFNLGTLVRNGVPNTSLEWEKKFQADLGLDLSFFRNRLGVRAGAYYAHHTDLLIDRQISAVYGSNEAYYDNAAAIRNIGAELSLRANPVHTRSFDWVLTASASWLHSRMADLGGVDQFIQTYTAYGDDAQTLLAVGHTPYEFYGYQTDGVFATTEEALRSGLKNTYGQSYQGGDVRFVDQNNDHIINDEDRVSLGSATPDFYGSFGTVLRYKAWSLAADFAYSVGNEAYNAVRRQTESMDDFCNQSTAVLNRWQMEGDETAMPRAAYGDPSGNNFFSDRWIEDASFLKLRTVKLGWSFDRTRFVGGQIWLAAENLWCLSDYLGADPEFSYSYAEALRGFDYAKVTLPVTFKLGFQLNF